MNKLKVLSVLWKVVNRQAPRFLCPVKMNRLEILLCGRPRTCRTQVSGTCCLFSLGTSELIDVQSEESKALFEPSMKNSWGGM